MSTAPSPPPLVAPVPSIAVLKASARMGWYEAAARFKNGPALVDFRCTSLETLMADKKTYSPSGVTKVGFMKADGVYARGAKKGRPRYLKDTERFEYVTKEELDRVMAAYESETGKCAHCDEGQVLESYSKTEGRKTKPCPKCDGTGKAKS